MGIFRMAMGIANCRLREVKEKQNVKLSKTVVGVHLKKACLLSDLDTSIFTPKFFSCG